MKIKKRTLVVSRVRWRAKNSRVTLESMPGQATWVFWALHSHSIPCMDKHECKDLMRNLQEKHMVKDGYPDIRYNFVIGNHARILEGRGWKVRSALPRRFADFRDKSVYIAFAGCGQDTFLSDKMKSKFEELVKFGIENSYIAKKFSLYMLARDEAEEDGTPLISSDRWDPSFYIKGNIYNIPKFKSPFAPELLDKAAKDGVLPSGVKLNLIGQSSNANDLVT